MSKREGRGLGITLTGFLLRLILIIIFVLLLIWLFPMPNLKNYYNSAFGENVDKMKDAAMSYYTNERLPKTENETVKMTLKEMLDKKLLVPFVDSKGKSCDTEHSYVEITKQGTEYLMKIYLSCDDQSDYVVIPMGCYNKCENGNCTPTKEKVCTTKYQYKKTTKGTKKVAYCEKGYTLKSGTCYKTTDIENAVDAKYKYTCSKYSGYTLIDTYCTKTTTDTKTATCPSGYTGNGTNCTKTTTSTQDATCPSGYTGNGTNCKKTTTSTQDATCPSGYTGNGTNCKKTTTSTQDATCPSGYSPNGSNCVKITTQDSTVYDASKTLIRTYTTQDCDTCSTVRHYVYRITSTKSYQCPDSTWTLSGTKCSKSTVSTKSYQCPDSTWTLSGTKCSKSTVSTKSYQCPDSTWTLSGTKCSKSTTDTKSYQCPDSTYKLNGTTCTKTTGDMKPATKEYYCTSGKLVGTKCVTSGQKIEKVKPKYKSQAYTSTKYTWSTKTSLSGWTKTGKTKTTCK